jgi:hypothetical protein
MNCNNSSKTQHLIKLIVHDDCVLQSRTDGCSLSQPGETCPTPQKLQKINLGNAAFISYGLIVCLDVHKHHWDSGCCCTDVHKGQVEHGGKDNEQVPKHSGIVYGQEQSIGERLKMFMF